MILGSFQINPLHTPLEIMERLPVMLLRGNQRSSIITWVSIVSKSITYKFCHGVNVIKIEDDIIFMYSYETIDMVVSKNGGMDDWTLLFVKY